MEYSGISPKGPLQGTLPDTIGPQLHLTDGTDLPLFDPISELRMRHQGGGTVTFEFIGDLWEMEDQRNWSDQSFKSVSTPASLGYYHEARPGHRFHQKLVIDATGFAAWSHPAADAVLVGPASATVVPAIGISCSRPNEALSAAALELFALMRPAHVRCDVDLSAEAEQAIAVAADRGAQVRAKLELAVFVAESQARSDELARLSRIVAEIRPIVARILLFSKDREVTSTETAAKGVEELSLFPEIPVVIGSDANFNELNRNRPEQTPASGLVWSMNPQVHASDELSLVENLEGQGETVRTARSFAPGLSLHVSPLTLRPRYNAVSTTGKAFEPEGLPWNTDPRSEPFRSRLDTGKRCGTCQSGN